jgi:arginase family enzyme
VEAVEMQALPAYEKLKFTGPVYLTFDMDVLDWIQRLLPGSGIASRGNVGARGDCAFTCD